MAMKEPRGQAKPIVGAVSKPDNSASCYNKMGNAATSAHPIEGAQKIGESALPPPKGTGKPSVY